MSRPASRSRRAICCSSSTRPRRTPTPPPREDALNAEPAPRSRAAASRSRRSGAPRSKTRAAAQRLGSSAQRPTAPSRQPIPTPSRRSPDGPSSTIAWDEAIAEVVPPARGGGAARRSRPALGRAQGARQADGAEARDPEAPRHEHRLPAHADGHAERARRDAPGGDRQARSAPRSTFTTPRRSWRSRSRSSPPTRAS